MLLSTLELVGIFVFALSGAILAVRHGLDLFGVLALAFVAAVFGGVIRDVLLGALPPAALMSWQPLALASAAGLFAFVACPLLERLNRPVRLFDAAGLSLFAVTGTHKALLYGVDPIMAAIVGMITAIGGGMIRDVLTARVPVVLEADLYAVAALAAALIVVTGEALDLPPAPVAIVGAAVCVVLRLLALYRGWRLPTASTRPSGPRP